MVIEINKDIDRYQESVALGLTDKQLIFSIASVAVGDFYSYNGMDFYEYMGKKLKFMFSNYPLVYMSTEGDLAIKEYQMKQLGTGRKKKGKGWQTCRTCQ